MAITKQDVLHVAELARLALTEEETETYTVQLQRILSHVEKLSALDASGATPAGFDALEMQVLREDAATQSLKEGDAMKNAPQKEHGCFKVPQIIE